MQFPTMNWLPMLVCLILNIVIGSLWYGPKTFFPVWWKAIGKDAKESPQGTPVTWILLILAGAVQIFFVALAVKVTKMDNALTGLLTGFVIWLGFVASTSLTVNLFPGRMKAWFIESGYHLINFLAFGAILGAWH